MTGLRPGHTLGVKGLNTGLRALFCICLLFLSTAPFVEPTRIKLPGTEHTTNGVTAPPTPLLEPQTRFGAFGGLERRLGTLPVANGLWISAYFYGISLAPTPDRTNLKPLELAELQQWRLEGG